MKTAVPKRTPAKIALFTKKIATSNTAACLSSMKSSHIVPIAVLSSLFFMTMLIMFGGALAMAMRPAGDTLRRTTSKSELVSPGGLVGVSLSRTVTDPSCTPR